MQSISKIHFQTILKQDVPQYIIDFFSKGIQLQGNDLQHFGIKVKVVFFGMILYCFKL
jgi:hypothetical protein